MVQNDSVAKRFEARLRAKAISLSPQITDAGLLFGAGTFLVRMSLRTNNMRHLALEEDRERLLALLSIAARRSLSKDALRHIQAASRIWESGDKALANLRLAFARLPQLEGAAGAYRLWLAETLLDDGLSPYKLMKELGLDPVSLDLLKYDENQPRVPAGNGRESGRWGPGEGGASSPANKPDPYRVTISEARITPQPVAAPSSAARSPIPPPPPAAPAVGGAVATELFAAGETGTFVAGLSALVAAVGAVIVGGVILVPWQKSPLSEGQIPGDSNLHYKIDNDTGALRLFRQTENGAEQVAAARQGRDGIFFEEETGLPIARQVKGGLAFDADSLAETTEDQGTKDQEDDEPKLCPDPGPDAPHGASERAKAYQMQISALNNPQRPLTEGLAVSLINPETGRRVVYDDCRERDGTMIEAKGPGYGRMLGSQYFRDKFTDRWTRQASRQISASGGRPLEWYFADREAAEFARKLFNSNDNLKRIKVIYEPAKML